MKRVLVSVTGGVVQGIFGDPDVEVVVIDWDSDGNSTRSLWVETIAHGKVPCELAVWTPEPLSVDSDEARAWTKYREEA